MLKILRAVGFPEFLLLSPTGERCVCFEPLSKPSSSSYVANKGFFMPLFMLKVWLYICLDPPILEIRPSSMSSSFPLRCLLEFGLWCSYFYFDCTSYDYALCEQFGDLESLLLA